MKNEDRDLRYTKEFLYYLGGKYYVIGRGECKECMDANLIEKYKQFQEKTASEVFGKSDSREVKRNKETIELYDDIVLKCHASENECDQSKFELRQRLMREYHDDIEAQMNLWFKAYELSDHLKGKNKSHHSLKTCLKS